MGLVTPTANFGLLTESEVRIIQGVLDEYALTVGFDTDGLDGGWWFRIFAEQGGRSILQRELTLSVPSQFNLDLAARDLGPIAKQTVIAFLEMVVGQLRSGETELQRNMRSVIRSQMRQSNPEEKIGALMKGRRINVNEE